MGRLRTTQNLLNKALSMFVIVCLVLALAPATAQADTTIGVKVEAPAQVNETVVIGDGTTDEKGAVGSGADGEASKDATDVAPASERTDSEVALGSDAPTPKPSQITTDVTLGASSSQAEALLVDGLTYLVDHKTGSATLTGWYGNAPTGDLSIPSQVTDGKTIYGVEIAGGGRF